MWVRHPPCVTQRVVQGKCVGVDSGAQREERKSFSVPVSGLLSRFRMWVRPFTTHFLNLKG